VEVVSQNVVFTPVVLEGLQRITYDAEGWAERLILPSTSRELAVVDPLVAGGQPITVRGGAPIPSILRRFSGGEYPSDLAADFEVPERDVVDIIRAFHSPSEAA
jgi:uncharacterized protein (DUF433 family)